jgi:hypothetical protein
VFIRRALLTTAAAALAAGVVIAPAALEAPAAAARAAGSVANASCGNLPAKAQVAKKDRAARLPSLRIEWLGCGQGTSDVEWVTITGHDWYAQVPGRAPLCMHSGERFYPTNGGYEQTLVVYRTVRCR